MHGYQNVQLHHPLPEWVELGQSERPRPSQAGRRRGADQHRSSPPLHAPLQFLDGLVHDGKGHDGRWEDAPFVVERPVLQHPLVEGVDNDVAFVGGVPEALLNQRRQGGVHHGVVQAQLVHQLQSGFRGEKRGQGVDRLHDLPVRLALGIAAFEVLLLGAGRAHPLERGVGDVLADLAPHHDLGAALVVDVIDQASVGVGQVFGKGLGGLVHVVIGIENWEIKLARRHTDHHIPGVR